jgi:hypothetical protein
MSSDQILGWRDCLTEQLRERHGLGENEARKVADRWLRSKVGAAQPTRAQSTPVELGTRDQQGASNQRLRIKSAVSRARAASQST